MRQCQKCGNMILDGQVACAKCGTPVQPEQPEAKSAPAPTMPAMGQATPASQPVATASAMPAMGQPNQPAMEPAASPASTQQASNPLQSAAPSPSLPPVSQPATFESKLVEPMGAEPKNTLTPAPEPLVEAINEQPTDEKFKGLKIGGGAKVSKKTWIIVGVCVAVIAVIAIVMVVMMSGGNKGNSGNDAPNTAVVSTTDFEIGDYIISIPEGYSYQIEDDGSVTLTNDAESWIANLYYDDEIKYETLESNFTTVATSYQSVPGVTKVQDAGTAKIGGRDYLYVDVIGDSIPTGTYAYTKIGDYIFGINLETANKEFNHDLLEELTPIIDGAEKATGIEDSFKKGAFKLVRVDLKAAVDSKPAENSEETPSEETPTEAPAETPEEATIEIDL